MNSEELLKTLESLTNKLKVANQIAAELEDFEAEELMEMSLNGLIKIAEGNNIDLTDVSYAETEDVSNEEMEDFALNRNGDTEENDVENFQGVSDPDGKGMEEHLGVN